MFKENSKTGKFIGVCDSIAKLAAGVAVVIVVTTTFVPIIGKYANAISAWRFGANGVVKYETGFDQDKGRRAPTPNNGDLYLLRQGKREYSDLSFGDVIQARGSNHFRVLEGCDKKENCGSSPIVFVLRNGQCAVVLSKLYEDNGKDDNDFKDKLGGWLQVATTPCGLFN